LARLLMAEEAATVGVVLAEVLRGARNQQDFEELADQLQAAVLIDDDHDSWLQASRILFELKLQGQVIPLADAIIAAHALLGGHEVYTTDEHFQRVPGVRLH
jgi:predicted nucleic acid-binding protein